MQYKTFGEYKQNFIISKLRKILQKGELFMFDAKLTKAQHEKIKADFENLLTEQLQENNQVENSEDNQIKDIEKLINLKDFSA